MKSFEHLIAEADEILEKRASSNKASEFGQDEVYKIANDLMEVETKSPDTSVATLTEKIAHSLAIAEVFANLPLIRSMIQFEKQALDSGHDPEKIADYLEKNGGKTGYISMSEVIPWLEAGI